MNLLHSQTHRWMAAAAVSQRKEPYRACLVGETGRGEYGHLIDEALMNRPDVTVVAVADTDEAGRNKVKEKTGAKTAYADYQEMLEKEKPELVALCSRRPARHAEMALAAIEIGAHLLVEKPFTRTLQEADAVIEAAETKGIRIAVAHQSRTSLSFLHLAKKIEEGMLGEILELRARGKEDHRAGGEDMMVLGTHLFDMMQFFGGPPQSCQAKVYQDGRPIEPGDVHEVDEELGPIAGNDISAHYRMAGQIPAFFSSKLNAEKGGRKFGLDIFGSKGIATVRLGHNPDIQVLPRGDWTIDIFSAEAWQPLPGDPLAGVPRDAQATRENNRRLVDDLIVSIETKRRPAVGAHEARTALEMILAPYASQITGNLVSIPLQDRMHPLERFR